MTFPETRLSVIEALGSSDAALRARALDTVARVYRAPVIAVLRYRWALDEHDAEDLAQEFLAQAFSKEWLQRYDPRRARFRTFLRSLLMAFASTAHESAGRLKRGGGARHISLADWDQDGGQHGAAVDPEVERLFEQEWVRSVFTGALGALRAECEASGKQAAYDVFVAYDVEGASLVERPSYANVAASLSIPVTQVTNLLNWSRPRFRAAVLDTLRGLTDSDAEFRAEARALLGVDVA